LISSLSDIEAVMKKMTSLGFIAEELLSERYFFERLVVIRGEAAKE